MARQFPVAGVTADLSPSCCSSSSSEAGALTDRAPIGRASVRCLVRLWTSRLKEFRSVRWRVSRTGIGEVGAGPRSRPAFFRWDRSEVFGVWGDTVRDGACSWISAVDSDDDRGTVLVSLRLVAVALSACCVSSTLLCARFSRSVGMTANTRGFNFFARPFLDRLVSHGCCSTGLGCGCTCSNFFPCSTCGALLTVLAAGGGTGTVPGDVPAPLGHGGVTAA